MTIPDDTFLDSIPAKGVGSEHLRDRLILPGHIAFDAILAEHLHSSIFGAVGNITTIDPDDPAAAGVTGLIADAGHQHAFTTAAPIEISGSTNNEGSAATMARSDHDHAFPETLGNSVVTTETTTSTTFTDLATVGPSVTLTPPASGKVLVSIFATLFNSGANFTLMSFALSSGNTLAASDGNALAIDVANQHQFGATFLLTGLAVSSTLFRMKYRVTAGTGSFQRRNLIVQPLAA